MLKIRYLLPKKMQWFFFDLILITLPCYIRCHRAGSQLIKFILKPLILWCATFLWYIVQVTPPAIQSFSRQVGKTCDCAPCRNPWGPPMSPDSPQGEVVAFGEAYRTSDLLRCRLSCSSPGYGHKCVEDIRKNRPNHPILICIFFKLWIIPTNNVL